MADSESSNTVGFSGLTRFHPGMDRPAEVESRQDLILSLTGTLLQSIDRLPVAPVIGRDQVAWRRGSEVVSVVGTVPPEINVRTQAAAQVAGVVVANSISEGTANPAVLGSKKVVNRAADDICVQTVPALGMLIAGQKGYDGRGLRDGLRTVAAAAQTSFKRHDAGWSSCPAIKEGA